MGFVSLLCAALGLGALALPGLGKYLALGLGIFALGAGVVGFRRGRSRARLAAAGGITLAIGALLLGGAKIGLTAMALSRLRDILAPP